MITLEDKIARCLDLQNKFNMKVNSEWRRADYAWKRAMWIEAGELADHYGYKWWKNVGKEPDRNQVLLELVDIFHFLLSDVMVRSNGTSKEYASQLFNSYAYATAHMPKQTNAGDKSFQLGIVDDFVFECLDSSRPPVIGYFRMVISMGFSFEDIIDYYLGKNVLNLFRYDNGYIDGSYRKIWGEVEDNVVLESILNSGERDFETIYRKLGEIYNSYK